MAMKRSDYLKFRKTGGSLTSQSSYALTLTRKQKAAEDDYYDNAYNTGLLSASDYLNNLKQRQLRTYLSPLQKQNLEQKIAATTTDYEDSQIETAYKTGATYQGQTIDTKFMADRAKKKLDTMVPGSEAYNKQQTLVSSLEDKAGKEDRRTYRMNELQKLSTMREESSTEMTSKAQLYEKLQAMAVADGETSEAQQYEIQKNAYTQSADKAKVNERIQDVMVKNSVPYDPMSKAGGAAAPAGGTNLRSQGGNTPQPGSAPTPTEGGEAPTDQPVDDTGMPEMVQAYGITMDKDVYETLSKDPSLSRYMKTINNYAKAINGDGGRNGLSQKIEDQGKLVEVYKSELANAKADNRDWLTKSYNDAVEKYNGLVQNRDDYMSKIDEEQSGFQEFIQKKVVTIMKDKDTDFERQMDSKTRDLQYKFSKGEITPEEYVKETYNMNKQAATVYALRQEQYTNLNDPVGLSTAEKRLTQYGDRAEIIGTQIDPKLKAGALRMVQSDKDNPEELNLATMSTGVKKGDFILVDPTADSEDPVKSLQEFDNQHAQLGGKWFPVKADISKAPESFKDTAAKEEYAKSKNQFVISQIKDGQETTVPIKAVKYDGGNVKYVPEGDLKKYIDQGYYKQKGDEIVRTYKEVNVPWEATKNIVKAVPGAFLQVAKDLLSGKSVQAVADKVGSVLPGTYDKSTGMWSPFKKETSNNSQSFLQQASDLLVPKASAKEPSRGELEMALPRKTWNEPEPIGTTAPEPGSNWVDVITANALKGVPAGNLAAAQQNIPYIVNALKEAGILDPNNLAYALATVQRETGGTYRPIEEYGGKAQAQKLGYGGGDKYYGRGYIQLTHDYNYKDIGRKIGMGDQLYNNPELALRPDVSAKILATFMKDRGVTEYTKNGDFVGARKPINGTDKNYQIASTAKGFLAGIPTSSNPITTPKVNEVKSSTSTNAVQYQPKEENFIDKVLQFFNPPKVEASDGQPKQQNQSSQQQNQPSQSFITKATTPVAKQLSTPKKSTPAPAPVGGGFNYQEAMRSMPTPVTPKPSITNTIKNVATKATNWLKNWF